MIQEDEKEYLSKPPSSVIVNEWNEVPLPSQIKKNPALDKLKPTINTSAPTSTVNKKTLVTAAITGNNMIAKIGK